MIRSALQHATIRLRTCSDTPRLDAELMLARLLGVDRSYFVIRDDEGLDPEISRAFEDLIEQRLGGTPVAYALGYKDFWNSRFTVSSAVLIPRPDTELLVETALVWLTGRANPRVLDLGTGSGAIGLSVALERPDALVDLVDVSPAALAVAEANRQKLGALNTRLLEGSWFEPVANHTYDLILSNPPYIAPGDPHLQDSGLQCEPLGALVADEGGLADLRRIGSQAPQYLAPGGRLLLEHGYDQGEATRSILSAHGFREVMTLRDLAGRERATGGVRPD
jgi:release factor glutamine methyltransferase